MRRRALSADEPPALPPGTRIRGYVIERLIASGGMGMVYLARDTALNMTVAIKALRPSVARDPEHRSRLKHEAQLMAQLAGHPNIATVHALLDEDDALYIVEECLPGPTLRGLLAQGGHFRQPTRLPWRSRCSARSTPRTDSGSSTAISSRRT